MNPDPLQQTWQTQPERTRLTTDVDLLLQELRRKQRDFAAMIFWRDVREVGTGLVLVPVWFYLGAKDSLPWSWYLMIPVLLWVTGFILVDRWRHKRQPPESGEPLRQCVEHSLAQVEHQIWLLRHVFWWGLLPFALAMLWFFGQSAWQQRAGGWWTVLAVSPVVSLGVTVLAGVYWINRYAVRANLEPRRRELETLILSLKDETP